MAQNNTTDGPEVLKESVADVALKTYTLYFLVTSIILGLLLLASLRKAAKICCWRYMYGSKYTRNEKEDPRVPATLFRTPSILTTLQDHYDKGRSLRSTAKSEATSRSYVSAQDIEYAIGEGSPRVHRYLDPESDKGDGEGADTVEVTDEVSGTEMAGGDVKERTERTESDEERNVDETDSETDGSKTGNDEKESRENDRGTEAAEEQTGSDDEQYADASSKDGTDDQTKYEPESGELIARSEDTKESGNAEDTDDDNDSEKEDTLPKNDPSSYVSEIVFEEDTVTCGRSDHSIELQEMADPDSFIIGRQPSVSEESASSTVNDIAPLVTRPTPPASVSGRHGRYKKNTGQKSTSGSSARSTSAKLSKRVKQT